jgi:hypothetical protein
VTETVRELETEMLAAANNLEFEKAALLRDQIRELKRQFGQTSAPPKPSPRKPRQQWSIGRESAANRAARLRLPPFTSVYTVAELRGHPGMKILEQLAKPAVQSPVSPGSGPMPFAPDPDEVPGLLHGVPIEPVPPTTHRTVKGKLHYRGKSQPLPVVDPWE